MAATFGLEAFSAGRLEPRLLRGIPNDQFTTPAGTRNTLGTYPGSVTSNAITVRVGSRTSSDSEPQPPSGFCSVNLTPTNRRCHPRRWEAPRVEREPRGWR
jgi:hypothetical protein